jgi:hypothetical protein
LTAVFATSSVPIVRWCTNVPSHGSSGMSAGSALAGSPIQIQASFQRSTSG